MGAEETSFEPLLSVDLGLKSSVAVEVVLVTKGHSLGESRQSIASCVCERGPLLGLSLRPASRSVSD